MSNGLQWDIFEYLNRLPHFFQELGVFKLCSLLTIRYLVMLCPAIEDCRPMLGYRPVAVAVDPLVLSPQHPVLFARSGD